MHDIEWLDKSIMIKLSQWAKAALKLNDKLKY